MEKKKTLEELVNEIQEEDRNIYLARLKFEKRIAAKERIINLSLFLTGILLGSWGMIILGWVMNNE